MNFEINRQKTLDLSQLNCGLNSTSYSRPVNPQEEGRVRGTTTTIRVATNRAKQVQQEEEQQPQEKLKNIDENTVFLQGLQLPEYQEKIIISEI